MKQKNSHTSTLFQYTNRGDTLCRMIREGLKYSYCKEEISAQTFVGLPMISFCDIPLSRSQEHCKKYGNYAIGIAKDYLLETNNLCQGSVTYIHTQFDVDVFDRLNDNKLLGFLKSYSMYRKEKLQINYDECEWRIVYEANRPLRDGSICKWFHNKKVYDEWRETVNEKFINAAPLQFPIEAINYLVVNQKANVKNFIEKLARMDSMQGVPLNDKDRRMLISKVISFEDIKNDY